MGRHRDTSSRLVGDLRRTIDCLPVRTREAMLGGIRSHDRIIVGAYSDRDGGVCPMLAAHRRGGRTNFLSFARSWDRFTRAGRKVRQATRPELAILVSQLEGSLLSEATVELGVAIEQHRALGARRAAAEGDPADEILAARLCASGRAPLGDSPSRRGAANVASSVSAHA
jgi:hypothetical protein